MAKSSNAIHASERSGTDSAGAALSNSGRCGGRAIAAPDAFEGVKCADLLNAYLFAGQDADHAGRGIGIGIALMRPMPRGAAEIDKPAALPRYAPTQPWAT